MPNLTSNLFPNPVVRGNRDLKIFHKIWWHLHQNYSFFETREVDWTREYQVSAKKLGEKPSASLVKKEVQRILSRLEDGHVRLNDKVLVDYGTDPRPLKNRLSRLSLSRDRIVAAGGDLVYGWLAMDPSVGLLRVDSMNRHVSRRRLETAFSYLRGARALIVDLRFNDGGLDEVAFEMVSHFVKGRHLSHRVSKVEKGRVQVARPIYFHGRRDSFRGAVAILSSPLTASAAEVALIAVRSVREKRKSPLLIFGDRSEGITSDQYQFKTSGIEIHYSGEILYDRWGNVFERFGVPVDVPAKYSSEDLNVPIKKRVLRFERAIQQSLECGRDSDVELALSHLRD